MAHFDRFMIGQYGGYDEKKQRRDFRKGFYGVEACLFKSEEDIKALKQVSFTENFKLSIHFPLRANQWFARDPLYLSRDSQILTDSYTFMDREFDYASKYGVDYILLHYPKPVIIGELNTSQWRFGSKEEYCLESEYPYDEFERKSCDFFDWISKKADAMGFKPVLEFDAVNKYITETKLLDELLHKYPNIRLCLDIGRIHIQDKLDPNFCGYDFAERYAQYAEVVHLANAQVDGEIKTYHYPALPTLRKEDNWADIETYLKIINQQNKSYKILFEHRSDLISDEELEACYQWVAGMI